jgi:hypothetical protein
MLYAQEIIKDGIKRYSIILYQTYHSCQTTGGEFIELIECEG